MYTLKAGTPVIEFAKLCYRADRPFLLVGSHGVGKSELLAEAAADLGIDYIVRDLSIMEPTDLSGLPKAKGTTTTYLPPAFLPTSGRGLFVIEELNRAERYMRAPMLQLLTARKLNDYSLPPGWLPVAAINPPDQDGGYQVDELDPALASRFTGVVVKADTGLWLEWARRKDTHSSVINYVQSDPTAFDSAESSPRSWKYLSDLLKTEEKFNTAPSVLRSAVMGTVGDTRGKAFLATLRRPARPLTADQVLDGYERCKDQIIKWVSIGRTDLLQASMQAVCIAVQPEADYFAVRRNAARWTNLGRFFADLPGDLREQARNLFLSRGYEIPGGARAKRGKAVAR